MTMHHWTCQKCGAFIPLKEVWLGCRCLTDEERERLKDLLDRMKGATK